MGGKKDAGGPRKPRCWLERIIPEGLKRTARLPLWLSLAMERNHAQAGSLRSKAAGALVAKGEFEVWHPLPNTPDFTLMACNRLAPFNRVAHRRRRHAEKRSHVSGRKSSVTNRPETEKAF